MNFDKSNFLKDCENKSKTCRAYSKVFTYARTRFETHIRSTLSAAPQEEIRFFCLKIFASKETCGSPAVEMTDEEYQDINAKLGNVFLDNTC